VVSSPTDEQLLANHLKGDPDAFGSLVDRHHRELFGFIVRFTGSRAAAEDVVQEAFLQVHLAATSFDPERRLKPWLFTIAANKARDFLRSRVRRREVPLDAPVDLRADSDEERFLALMANAGPTPVADLERAETGLMVRETVGQLPPALREVLLLAYFHNFAYKEMADILDIPLGTVKSRLHSAVGRFAKLFRAGQNRRGGKAV
jgi:RNA polymerase sigma-70 factor (ECF subfamily)